MPRRAKRRFGQHFLEPAWIDRLVRVVDPNVTDTFLEVGPGRGALTAALSRVGATVVAVEIDGDLVADLAPRVPANVTVVHADFLDVELDTLPLPPAGVRVVGNLPYNAAAPILLKLFRASAWGRCLRDATVMLQREVADRVTARPGDRGWGALAVAAALHADATRVLTIPPGAFRPMPKVTSAAVTLRFRAPGVRVTHPALFDGLVRAIFTQRRKTVLNASRRFVAATSTLTPESALARAGVDPTRRPGELGLSELAEIVEVLASSPR